MPPRTNTPMPAGDFASIVSSSQLACPRKCGEYIVFTPDAIGRMRERCPKCDGVAKSPTLRPGEVRRPQHGLPMIKPGQLRCQVCARGVMKTARFCVDCQPATTLEAKSTFGVKHCLRCAEPFQATGPNSKYCKRPECR